MRELLALQLVEIGAAFGGRDHSTVIHSLERVAANACERSRLLHNELPGFVFFSRGLPAELNSSSLSTYRTVLHFPSSAIDRFLQLSSTFTTSRYSCCGSARIAPHMIHSSYGSSN